MKTTEVNKKLIGRRCECIFTGMMVYQRIIYKRITYRLTRNIQYWITG